MGLEQDLGIDLDTLNFDDAEKAIQSSGLVPEGFHHAVLESVKSGTANSGTPFREFTFQVLAGPAKGATVTHTLWLPNAGQDEAKRKKSMNQLAIYMHRLGLKEKVTKDGKSSLAEVKGRHDFIDCLGQECVIEAEHYEEVWKDKRTQADRKMTKARLSWEGVYLLDDKRVKDVPRGKAGPISNTTARLPQKKDEFAGI
jgi:hypothetical protein